MLQAMLTERLHITFVDQWGGAYPARAVVVLSPTAKMWGCDPIKL